MTRDLNGKTWEFIAVSKGRRSVLELAKRISASNCPTLIIGPTGVGKEVLAEDIHMHSPRVDGKTIMLLLYAQWKRLL